MLLLHFRMHYNYRCFKSDIIRLILVSGYKPPFITVEFTTTVLLLILEEYRAGV